ncbi:MAG: rhomboid family intramembrane serine protease [Halobacteriaceae archaeon]
MAGVETVLRGLVIVGLFLGLGIAHRLDDAEAGWITRLRRRLLWGVPWGTVVMAGLLLVVYLGLQRGLTHWWNPLTVPYVSWSYLYPLGVLTAAFAHSGPGHLIGNLVGTVLLGPVVEYAIGHYPRSRGSSSFAGLRNHPYVRAFILLPGVATLLAVTTALFHWGPIIGFSGVVYALAGFGLVTLPVVTVLALVARDAVGTTYYALLDPIVVAAPGPSYGGPWWAGIAVQGHLFGLIVGVVLGLLFVRRRATPVPSATRIWVASSLAGFSLTLWALWWYGPGNSYELFRGVGVLLILTLATLVTAATRASTRDLLPDRGWFTERQLGVTRRRVATLVLVLALTTMAAIAVPVNLTTVASDAAPADAVSVRDYTVFYAEGARNQNVPAVDISVFGASTNVTTSGVIVVSEARHLWTREVSAGALAFFGQVTVAVGGPGWRRAVDVRRRGWIPVGGEPVYVVSLRPPDGEWRTTFAADRSRATPTIAGRNVSIAVVRGQFELVVTQAGRTVDTVPIPETNGSVSAGGLSFVRNGSRIIVVEGTTRIVIAEREEYV